MPSIRDYQRRAPFTADELVSIAQELLPVFGSQVFTKRTLRFYIAKGVVHRPLGSPKFARYGYEHLLQLLATRMNQDQGYKLELIAKETAKAFTPEIDSLEEQVDRWLQRQRGERMVVRENRAGYGEQESVLPGEERVRRIRLTEEAVIELRGSGEIQIQLDRARQRLEELVAKAK